MRRFAGLASVGVLLVLVPGGAGTTRVAPTTYSLTGRQAQEVGVLAGFLDAYNRRQLDRALSYLAADVGVSDCDYRRVRAVEYRGRRAVARWLSQRFADRDRLEVERVFNANPEQPTRVAGVEFSRRTSTTLRALGFPAGIRPAGAKAVFRPVTARIFALGMGPVGGNPELCRPG